MAKEIFVNLPVKDLKMTMEFFAGLGFTFNAEFTNDDAACLVIGENIYAMLLTEPFFKGFTKKQIADSSKTTEVIIAISESSKAAVDELADKALKIGGKASNDPQDYGWMYSRSFQDLNGHLWEVLYADPAGPSGK